MMSSDQPPDLRLAVRTRRRRFWTWALSPWIALVLLVAGFYAVENWRGARAWARVHAELTAKGEPLDRAAVVPPPVPDDARNLAMAPPFARLLGYETGPDGVTRFPRVSPADPSGLAKAPRDDSSRPPPVGSAGTDWQRARPGDLTLWQDYYRKAATGYFPLPPERGTPARDVLAALDRFSPALDELAREAAARPETRFPLDYEVSPAAAIRLPQLQILQHLAQTLQLRATARLEANQPREALRDVELGIRLRDGPIRDPVLVSNLFAQTTTGLFFGPIREGLAARRWNPAELARLQVAIGRADPLAEYRTALRGERAYFFLDTVTYTEQNRTAAIFTKLDFNTLDVGKPNRLVDALVWAAPRGWFDQNRAVGCRLSQGFIEAVDPAAHRIFLDRHATASQAVNSSTTNPTTILARMVMPVLANTLTTSARHAAAVDLAVTACALERRFLERGDYPATLDALVPVYLPRVPTDLMDGAPLRYARTADGRFRLWSIGWDGLDEGGKVVFEESGRVDRKRGDWVWQYAPPTDAPGSPPVSATPAPEK